MFVKRDRRKLKEILDDEDDLTELRLQRRATEFALKSPLNIMDKSGSLCRNVKSLSLYDCALGTQEAAAINVLTSVCPVLHTVSYGQRSKSRLNRI